MWEITYLADGNTWYPSWGGGSLLTNLLQHDLVDIAAALSGVKIRTANR